MDKSFCELFKKTNEGLRCHLPSNLTMRLKPGKGLLELYFNDFVEKGNKYITIVNEIE